MREVKEDVSRIIYNSKAGQKVCSYPMGEKLLKEREFRAQASIYAGLIINILYALFKLIVSLVFRSVWFGAVGVYYALLALIRFILAAYLHQERTIKKSMERKIHEWKCYRLTAYLMFVLNIAMSGMIIQMICSNRSYRYPGHLIYGSAAFTLYYVTTAVINLITYSKLERPILSASKALSFAGALMSILTLQTALIAQFGTNGAGLRRTINIFTGSAVCLTVFIMAITMVIKSSVKLKKTGDS